MGAALRLVRASWLFGVILASYLVQLALGKLSRAAWIERRWARVHRANARRLYKGCVRLRGVWIKLGQVLSIMGTFLPRAYVEELEGLQDRVPPRPWREIKGALEAGLGGRRVEDAFRELAHEPLAAASLGQVHRASVDGMGDVAVKVLYPNIQAIIRVDLRVIGWAMRVYEKFMPVSGIGRVIDQLTDLLARETDYVLEGRNMERMAANFTAEKDILFPRVHWPLTSKTVLVMSFMPGFKITDRGALEREGVEPTRVARRLVEAFYKQLFLDGFFHADPHPGNFLVQATPDGPRLVVLDFGSATECRRELIDGMLEILRGLVGRDDGLVIRGIHTMGFVAPGGDQALLEKTIKAYFQKLLALDIQDFGNLGPDVQKALADPGVTLGELREVMRAVEYPDGWFFVERAVVILFGLSAQLAPRLNTIQVGFPYIMQRLVAPPVSAPVRSEAARD